MTEDPLPVTVRFFAAAEEAAGVAHIMVPWSGGMTVADVVSAVVHRTPAVETALQSCSFLCEGIAVLSLDHPVAGGNTVDALPPFSGG